MATTTAPVAVGVVLAIGPLAATVPCATTVAFAEMDAGAGSGVLVPVAVGDGVAVGVVFGVAERPIHQVMVTAVFGEGVPEGPTSSIGNVTVVGWPLGGVQE
ncbi:hypothetical protein [Spongiactinospora rosea]|uniref:hypothetical protein n=1 Tax=Spongiactinospora rosea TaxID=2248750 RepID=UPI000DE9C2FA|nr:hypothetical protein [Spongiactinospora rosea]